ncbi:transglutaminase-like domain-containing protein, partial [Chitinophaga sp.]|uniref:transglutaminase-like domain-containing protein n=1 Tax=Chitinophaga sp. TaxID=1869181 RepID=UPI002FDE6618
PMYLRPWAFQTIDMPVLWSEYEVSLPEYYEYLFLSQGYHPFHIKNSKDSRKTFSFNVEGASSASASRACWRHVSVTPGVTTHRWVMKDVPPLKEESYVTTLRNYISYIEFQLSAIRFPESPVRNIMSTWPKMMEDLGKDDDYSGELARANNYLSDEVKRLTAGAASSTEKAEKVFAFVRDNYTCTDYSSLWKSQPLKTTFNKKNGNVADINMLLTAMLREAGLEAVPVLLSTRDYGKMYAMYPIRSKLNYTIVSVLADNTEYFLDATRPFLGFGKLHASCYNGPARKVNVSADLIAFGGFVVREVGDGHLHLARRKRPFEGALPAAIHFVRIIRRPRPHPGKREGRIFQGAGQRLCDGNRNVERRTEGTGELQQPTGGGL